jgi:hypothetical protein
MSSRLLVRSALAAPAPREEDEEEATFEELQEIQQKIGVKR